MKKILSVLLTIICVLAISTASAKTTKEITFNSIEWGSSPSSAMQSFDLTKLSFSQKTSEYWAESMDYYMKYFFEKTLNNRGRIGCIVELDKKNCKGAAGMEGYEIDDLKMYFVKKVNSAGKIFSDDSARLFFAYYHFSTQEGKKAYTAIKKKIINLYGEPDEEDSFLGDTGAYWIGANDTQAWLYLDNDLIADDEIYLKAGYMKADKWLKEAEEAYLLNPKSGNSTGGIPLGK